MKVMKCVGNILKLVVTFFLAVLLLFNLLTIGSKLVTGNKHPSVFGLSTAVVLSGSMEPEISVNDMVIICKQKEYAEKEIVTYISEGGSLITHRIIEKSDEGFLTKGDANNTVDSEAPICEQNIVGKVVFVIPYVGLVLGYLQTPLGMLSLVVFGIVLIMVPIVLERSRKG